MEMKVATGKANGVLPMRPLISDHSPYGKASYPSGQCEVEAARSLGDYSRRGECEVREQPMQVYICRQNNSRFE